MPSCRHQNPDKFEQDDRIWGGQDMDRKLTKKAPSYTIRGRPKSFKTETAVSGPGPGQYAFKNHWDKPKSYRLN